LRDKAPDWAIETDLSGASASTSAILEKVIRAAAEA
jgi:hypothetical protein